MHFKTCFLPGICVPRPTAQALTLFKARACHNGLAGVKCFKCQSNFSGRRLRRHDRARRECGQSHLDRRDVLHSAPASGQFPRARHGVLSGIGCIVAGPGRKAAPDGGRIWAGAGHGQRRTGGRRRTGAALAAGSSWRRKSEPCSRIRTIKARICEQDQEARGPTAKKVRGRQLNRVRDPRAANPGLGSTRAPG